MMLPVNRNRRGVGLDDLPGEVGAAVGGPIGQRRGDAVGSQVGGCYDRIWTCYDQMDSDYRPTPKLLGQP
jgi:hypothetical protein